MKRTAIVFLVALIYSACTTTKEATATFISAENDFALITLDLHREGDASLNIYTMPPIDEYDKPVPDSILQANDTITGDTRNSRAFADSILLTGKWKVRHHNYVVTLETNGKKVNIKDLFTPAPGNEKNNITIIDEQTVSFPVKDTTIWIYGVKCDKMLPLNFRF